MLSAPARHALCAKERVIADNRHAEGREEAEHVPASATQQVALQYKWFAQMASPKCDFMGQKQLLHTMQALSQCSLEMQSREFDLIMNFSLALAATGAVQPIALIHHTLYDETPLRLRCTFAAGVASLPQVGKTWVVEHGWTVLLQETGEPATGDGLTAEKFMMFKGKMSEPWDRFSSCPHPPTLPRGQMKSRAYSYQHEKYCFVNRNP